MRDNHNVLANLAQQAMEAVAPEGSSRRGLINDDEPLLANERPGNAKTLFHSTRIASKAFVPVLPQVGSLQQCMYQLFTLPNICNPCLCQVVYNISADILG